jgi:hypothetical protein
MALRDVIRDGGATPAPKTTKAAAPAATEQAPATPGGAAPPEGSVAGAPPTAGPLATTSANRSEQLQLASIFQAPDVGAALEKLGEDGFGGDLNLMNINGADEQLGAVMPQLKLVQLQTVERVEGLTSDDLGGYLHAVTGQVFPTLSCTLLAQKFGRQWLNKFGGEGLQVICAASRGVERDWPDDRSSDPKRAPAMGTKCADCPNAKWRGKEPPACSEMFALLEYVHETQEPVVLFVRKTAVKPWRAASQQLKVAGFRSKAQLGPAAAAVPLNLLVIFTVASEKVKNAKGTYYEPRFRSFVPLTDEDAIRAVVQAAAQIAPQFADTRAEDLDDGTDVFDEAAAAHGAEKGAAPGGNGGKGAPAAGGGNGGGFSGPSQGGGDSLDAAIDDEGEGF